VRGHCRARNYVSSRGASALPRRRRAVAPIHWEALPGTKGSTCASSFRVISPARRIEYPDLGERRLVCSARTPVLGSVFESAAKLVQRAGTARACSDPEDTERIPDLRALAANHRARILPTGPALTVPGCLRAMFPPTLDLEVCARRRSPLGSVETPDCSRAAIGDLGRIDARRASSWATVPRGHRLTASSGLSALQGAWPWSTR